MSRSRMLLEPDGDMNVGEDAVGIVAGDRAAPEGFDIRYMHLRPYRCLRIFELLAGADDVDLAEPGDEHRDIALPDIVLAAEIGEAGHEVVAMLERHPERAPGLQLACLHLKPPFLHVRQVQNHHPLPRKPSVYRHRLLRRRLAGAA